MKQQNYLLTTEEIAKKYRKPISTIQRWARLRLIPSIQLGHRSRLYDEAAVRRALLKKTVPELD